MCFLLAKKNQKEDHAEQMEVSYSEYLDTAELLYEWFSDLGEIDIASIGNADSKIIDLTSGKRIPTSKDLKMEADKTKKKLIKILGEIAASKDEQLARKSVSRDTVTLIMKFIAICDAVITETNPFESHSETKNTDTSEFLDEANRKFAIFGTVELKSLLHKLSILSLANRTSVEIIHIRRSCSELHDTIISSYRDIKDVSNEELEACGLSDIDTMKKLFVSLIEQCSRIMALEPLQPLSEQRDTKKESNETTNQENVDLQDRHDQPSIEDDIKTTPNYMDHILYN